jgi:HSP20 family protein
MPENNVARTENGSTRSEGAHNGKVFAPRVDIFETPTELLLYADLPGVRPYDIDLRYERGELVLHGKVPPAEAKGSPVLEDFATGDFHRVFQINETIDPSKIEAEHKNGVLTVHLPKQESAQPKQVQVRAG